MAVTTQRLSGGDISNWHTLAIGPQASVTDTYVRNAGESEAYISANQSWGSQITLPAGQAISFDGLSWADIQNLYVSDDGNGTVIEVLTISR